MKQFKKLLFASVILFLFCMIGCAKKDNNDIIDNREDSIIVGDINSNNNQENNETKKELVFMIDDNQYEVYWLNNDTVNSLINSINDKLIINLELGEGYQYGQIGISLPTNDLENDINIGDIVLLNGNTLKVAYSPLNEVCTKLGRINLRNNEIVDLLSEDSVIITLSINNYKG